MNKKIVGILVLLVTGLVFVGLVTAYQGTLTEERPFFNKEKTYFNSELHEQIVTAIENNDYEAWLQIHEGNDFGMKGRMYELITEDNFHLLSEMHSAKESGDFDAMWKIKEQLGFQGGKQFKNQRHFTGQDMPRGMMRGR